MLWDNGVRLVFLVVVGAHKSDADTEYIAREDRATKTA